MSNLTQHFRRADVWAGWHTWIVLCLSLLLPAAAQAQQPVLPAVPTSCSYTNAPANIVLTPLNVPSAGFSTLYLLVDMVTGAIVQTNATTPTFNGVGAGLYYAVAAHYTGALNNASAGKLISEVYEDDACLTYGPATAIKVCQAIGVCDFVSAPASVTFSANNVPGGVTTTYILVDEATNLIVKTSSSNSFGSIPIGDYAITAVHYSGTLAGLSVGNSLYGVTTNEANCFGVSNTIRVRVCNSPVAITGPANGGTVASLNPPISGTATPGTSITVTGGPGSTGGPCITTTDGNGNWTCSSLVFPNGPASATATDGSSNAVTNFTVAQPPVVVITGPANTTIATKNPPITGTATPFASILVDASGGQQCATVADANGAWTCSSLTFVNGPQSVTATATNSGGTSTPSANSFTVVVPPSIFINSPATGDVVATTTPTISGTATPGSPVVLTDPLGATLCSTTATASGTWSCVVGPLAAGPQNITAIAYDNGVPSTPSTTTFTVADPPSLMVTSPVNVSTTTTPTIAGTATPGSIIAITDPLGATLCTTTASVSGTFACALTTPLPVGLNTLTVTATSPGGSTSVPVTFTSVAVPTVAILSPATNGTATTTPTVSGTATPLASVTVLAPGGQSCLTTASLSGTFACNSLTFAAGPASVTAVASNPGGMSTPAVSSFTVTDCSSVTVAIMPTSTTICLTNTLALSAIGPLGGIYTWTGAGLTQTTGQTVILSSPSAGSAIYTVTLSVLGCITSASAVVTATPLACPPTVAITTPNNVTTTVTPTISGTATPNAVVTLMGGPGSTGGPISVTADNTGTYSTSALTFAAGPQTVTAVASNAGGTSSPATTSFTVVGPPSLTVTSPVNVSTTTTPTIAGMATPGALIAITDPLGATLCSTTASVSGTFACALTSSVPVGPTTLTVTATTPGGSTSVPVTFTTVSPPTVAILSPADSGTATTTPTISGTATPLASVTVLAPGGQSCVTTASASGTFACSSLTFAAGPQSVTATVSNPGGRATDVNAFTVVQPAINLLPVVMPDFNDVVVGLPATGNVLTNDKDPEGTPLTASLVGTPPAGFTMTPDGSYTYTAPVGTTAPVTVPIQVCDGATPPACATTTLTLLPVPVNNPATNDAPIANPDSPRTTTGVPVIVAVLANDVDPEGQPLSSPTIVSPPTHGTAVVKPDGTVSYTPTAGYTGTDQLTYSVCDGGTPPLCATALVTFTIEPTPPAGTTNTAPVALDDALLTTVGTSQTATVAANDSDPQGQPLVFSLLSIPSSGTLVFSPTGSYTYTPSPTFVGSDAFIYQVCDNATPALCATATAHLTVQPSTPPTIAILSPADNGTATTSPTVSGTATPLASVTVLAPGGQSCVTTASASGTFACSSLTFAAGPQSVTAIARNVNGTGIDVNSFTAVGPPSLTVTSPVNVSTTTTPTIAGMATPGALIAITDPLGATLCSTTASVSGTFACALTSSVPVGPTTLTVTATTPGGSTSVPITFTTVAPPTVAILSPADSGTATTTPTISGTATPLASVTVLAPGGQSCVTTASASGTFACSSLTFAAGPQSVTAVVSNPGGRATDVNAFTAVAPSGPASLTVAPTGPQTTTAPVISGTATPGSTIAITDPLGATLCTTTASASGTFACAVTVPVGPTTLTVSACTSGGCSTTTTSFTAVGPPAIAILSPTNSSSQPVGTNVVSGTATPGSMVILTTSTGESLTTTASPTTGVYSVTTAVPFPSGTDSVTAVASNVGGSSSPATSTFTIIAPPSLTATAPPVGGLTQVVSGTTAPNTPVVITGTGPLTLCTTTASASGTFACSVPLPVGPSTLTVTATGPGGATSVPVAVSAVVPPTVAILSPADNGTAITSPTVSGTATPLASVTVLAPGGQSCVTTASASGTFACSSLTFAAGPQSVTATVSTPGGTTTDVNTFTAVTPPGLTVTSPTGVSTTTTPTIAGTATPGSTIAITGPQGATLCTTTASASGTFACALTSPLPVGPTTLTVTATTPGGSTSVPITFTTVAPPTVAILSPVDGGTATTTPTISGTATPLVSVTVLGPNGQSCVTTASVSGTFACSSLTFAAGPQSVTAVVSTPGGTVADVNAFTAVAPVPIKVPVVIPDIANTSPGKPVLGNVLVNDSDPQGLPLTASLIGQPVAGTVTMAPDGSYTYTAPVGFTGTVSFCYTASNTAGLSASSCVQVNVIPDPVLTTNNRPIANNDNVQSTSGQSLTVAILANDGDPDSATGLNGQLAIPTIVSPPVVGTAVINVNGTVTYTSPAGFTGVVSFPYQVCDKASPALCTTATVTIRVDPTPPVGTTLAPVGVDDLLLVTANTTATATVAANDNDPQGLPLQFTTGQPANGTVVMSILGNYTYLPSVGFSGGDSFTYTVCNSAGKCDVATVSVLVQQPVDPTAVVLKLRVMLQGALFNSPDNLMRDDLRSQKFLPLTEPYSALGEARFTHVNGGGGETMPTSVTALNAGTGNAVVDWVFVELRSPSNLSLVVATRSAMVQRDGDVVLASDGVSPLSFTGLAGNSFYVSVKHRNHLGVMTATAVPLSATGTIVDFPSSTSAQVWNKVIGVFDFDGWEQVTVNGQQALWAGDANHNGKVKYQGSVNDLIAIFSEVAGAQNVIPGSPIVYNYNNALGYYFGDINMDGKVKYQGTSNDTSLIFINVITNFRTATQMNILQLYNFDFMLEQTP